MRRWFILGVIGVLLLAGSCRADDDTVGEDETVEVDIGKSRDGSRTDDEVVERESERVRSEGKAARGVENMIEKEIFLRELISNASDALDKIRFLSLTDKDALESNPVLNIKIKADKENHVLHVTDSGVGMTRDDLVNNLGTIARSGTSEFLSKMGDATDAQLQDLIGQFGVGFYSSFLIADKVIVTSKHNSDEQYIWESDAQSFSIARDPRGNTLGRGTTVSLHLKEEAYDFLEPDTVKDLIKRYSQFISFDIFLWTSKNVAKEGLKVDESEKSSERKEAMEKEYEPLLKWLKEKPLSDKIEKAVISERLSDSPCALVASQYGWSGNMERLVRSQAYAKRDDPTQQFYLNQKKTLEVNPRHPVIKELLRRVETEQDDPTTQDLAMLLFDTATMRSGFTLPDSYGFATRIEKMLRLSMNISPEEKDCDMNLRE
ncbi:PREDICTED: endoplasmin-like [Priapulus caudatus]|uniref:Endoplasmin-like n=1 Tax=Priapulus caudatus TaxID=37621 RepID=A0ABM1E970_PRICU|nr:PREDICTED: endoplasmin-like [Priapulus caudatus]